jgi:hypothetical protein
MENNKKDKLSQFNDAQLAQLRELFQESFKPKQDSQAIKPKKGFKVWQRKEKEEPQKIEPKIINNPMIDEEMEKYIMLMEHQAICEAQDCEMMELVLQFEEMEKGLHKIENLDNQHKGFLTYMGDVADKIIDW